MVRASCGTEIFITEVDPRDAESYQTCWAEVAKYVDKEPNSNVLVLMADKNRGAAVALAWLTEGSPKMHLKLAAQLLQHQCQKLDWTVAYAEQVVARDRTEALGE